jgi:hypothetical protein
VPCNLLVCSVSNVFRTQKQEETREREPQRVSATILFSCRAAGSSTMHSEMYSRHEAIVLVMMTG